MLTSCGCPLRTVLFHVSSAGCQLRQQDAACSGQARPVDAGPLRRGGGGPITNGRPRRVLQSEVRRRARARRRAQGRPRRPLTAAAARAGAGRHGRGPARFLRSLERQAMAPTKNCGDGLDAPARRATKSTSARRTPSRLHQGAASSLKMPQPNSRPTPTRAEGLARRGWRWMRGGFEEARSAGDDKRTETGGWGGKKGGELRIAVCSQFVLERTACLVDVSGGVEVRFTVALPASGRSIEGIWCARVLCERALDLALKAVVSRDGRRSREARCVRHQAEIVTRRARGEGPRGLCGRRRAPRAARRE